MYLRPTFTAAVDYVSICSFLFLDGEVKSGLHVVIILYRAKFSGPWMHYLEPYLGL